MLLRVGHVQPFARQEEELDHLDIGRQRTGMQRRGIGEIRIAAEQPVDHGRDEAAFQQTFDGRGFSSVSAEKKVSLIERSAAARA